MNRYMTLAVAAMGLTFGHTAQAHDDSPKNSSQPGIVVNNSANGSGNTLDIDPKTGQKVRINNSGNGTNNTIVVAPDANGKVVINASGNGNGNKIIVEEAPGEKVVVHGSGNGKDNVIIEKVPGPSPIKPLSSTPVKSTGGQPHHGRK